MPGPDYPGGAQIISSAADIAEAYRTGRGSLKVRARWKIEDLARGQWQLVVNELPPGVSTQKVLEEIEELTNPKIRAGKKALTAEQTQLKAAVLSVLDVVRDESSKDAAGAPGVRAQDQRISQDEFITTLLAQTSLESSSPINLTMVGIDGKPTQKSLRQMLQRVDRLPRDHGREALAASAGQGAGPHPHPRGPAAGAAQHRRGDRDHPRGATIPKAALIARFNLSERQAEDILEIRLRQLARLEAIKIEQELKGLREEQKKLEDILGSPAALRRLLVKEIEADAKSFEDPRRTLIQAEKRAVAEVRVVDEPVTVIVSQKGWVRAQKGWASERAAGAAAPEYSFKSGDALYGAFECRTVDTLLVFGTAKDKGVRVYTVPVASLPGGARRRPAGHDADRARQRHARGALLRRPAGRQRCCWPTRAATASSRRSRT